VGNSKLIEYLNDDLQTIVFLRFLSHYCVHSYSFTGIGGRLRLARIADLTDPPFLLQLFNLLLNKFYLAVLTFDQAAQLQILVFNFAVVNNGFFAAEAFNSFGNFFDFSLNLFSSKLESFGLRWDAFVENCSSMRDLFVESEHPVLEGGHEESAFGIEDLLTSYFID
jgi:hypothetical protein